MRGCDAPPTIPTISIGGETLTRCPRRLILEEPQAFGQAIDLYSLYDKGVLLRDGAIEDQPHAYLELMTVIRGAVSEIEAAHRDKANKKTGGKGGVNRGGGTKR